MEKISYGGTFFYKVIFPGFWFVFLTVFMLIGVLGPGKQQVVFVVQPLAMMAIGYFLFRKMIWNLADDVRDGGSYLLVRKGAIEKRIPLADVLNVSMSQFSNPKRLTLRLRSPCELGDEIAFIPKLPKFGFNPFARNAVAEDLMRRVDQARRGAFA